ncbi:MAG: hypothetical protein RL323_869 [Pseudomonadota bacterium]|jgi:hypothetical protein
MSGAPSIGPKLPIGINIDGVLEHDGLTTPHAATRFAWIQHSGAFDYIEKNIDPTEDFRPYFDLVQRYGIPIGVFGGIFCAGQDEAVMHWGLRTARKLGARVFNMQLYSRHANGQAIRNEQVADWFMDALDRGAASDCQPTLEVHVDMWSEQFRRVEEVANLLAQRGAPLFITLDHSHLIFKIGLAQELAASGLAEQPEGGRLQLEPGHATTFYDIWLKEGWVAHAHTRSVAPGVPCNRAMNRRRGLQGRAIQYPLIEPPPGTFHQPWRAQELNPWKQAVRELLAHMRQHPERTPQQISCEFIPFPDYGGGGRYSVWDNNIACAHWLRSEWEALQP